MSAKRGANRPAATRRDLYAGSGLGARLRSHRRAAADAAARLRAAPLASIATIAVSALAVLLPLLLAVVLGNALRFADSLGGSRELSVFLEASGDAAADAAAARRIADALARRADVASVTLRTPDEGLEEFRQMSDLADALDLLDGNPLPWVLLVAPAGAAAVDPAPLAGALASEPGIDSVPCDSIWRRGATRSP